MLIFARDFAGVAQLVEHDLAKVGGAGSSPVSRSNKDMPSHFMFRDGLFLLFEYTMFLLFFDRSPLQQSIILKIKPCASENPFFLGNITTDNPVDLISIAPAVFYHF